MEKSESPDRGLAIAFTLSAARPEKICGSLVLDPVTITPTNILDAPTSDELAHLMIGALSAPGSGNGISWQSRGMRWTFQAGEAGLHAAA